MIDTYEAVKQLEASGLTEEQAGALVKVINSTSGKLATKADLEALQAATKADLTALELRLIKWFVGGQAATIGIVVALIKLL